MTFGEGYHNFHHIFENDYRNGIRWWQFDPTKWLIKTASWLGLAEKLRVTPEEKIEKARATMQLQRATQKLSNKPNAAHRLQILQQEYDTLVAKMADYYTLKKQLLSLERDKLRQKSRKSGVKPAISRFETAFSSAKTELAGADGEICQLILNHCQRRVKNRSVMLSRFLFILYRDAVWQGFSCPHSGAFYA